ncbi:MAG TPA: tetraacyldisaccharide 4'-kinase [Arenimonas sp.]|uniref:tetraacyldisaccharide 4'-kinase n=1 Tax=Arenimonas sp. TaxID=1872635 RepID=UPI002D7E3EE2|nr:tetraacyldisaccharide 4'-kinase [Arenimonas sp.]HEU0153752.1 tetraacyldisaccharide 4'-kinase [Arenimonas sp.]
MKAALERWLLRRWYGGVAPGPGLKALAGCYRGLIALRAALYQRGLRRVHRLPVPVLVVGNLVAGGSGKTPLTIALARGLAERGWRPGIVSRGYGRRSQGPVQVALDMPASECGDEPLLIARQTGLPVFVDRDRVAAARRLVAAGCNLVIADDGLQHLRLGRDIEIEVVDGERRHGNGRLIPAGPLREPAGRRVDHRVINGGQPRGTRADHADTTPEWPMQLVLGNALPMAGGASRPLGAFGDGVLHAFAGIGHPARFFAALRAAGLAPIEHAFPDHHAFTADELAFTPPGPRLMTEKDAVKCAGLDLADAWAVPVRADLPDALFTALQTQLAAWSPAHGSA